MADADAPVTTLVPFNTLPSCVSDCGPLYDANGGCVPPGVAEGSEDTYINCFCQNSAVQGLYNDPPLDICNGNCAADPTGYTSLRDWFTDFCIGVQAGVAGATSTADSSSSASNSNSNGGGDWFSTHRRWVIMLIVIFVGIVTIWVGACIWRRRYLKKKDRIYKLGKNNPARTSGTGVWAPGSGVDVQHRAENVPNPNGSVPVFAPSQPQLPIPQPELVSTTTVEKKSKSKEKKKWIVKERT